MGKRKHGDVQFENGGNRTLKKPRTDTTQPTPDRTEEGARYTSTNTADSLPDQKETKEVRAARKLAKRLAKRQQRENKSKVENAQRRDSRDVDGDGDAAAAAAAMSPPPAKVPKSGNKPKKAHRKQSPILGDTASPAQHSQTSVAKGPGRKQSENQRKSRQAKKSQGQAKGDIKINYEGKDNKIILDNWHGRGDSLLRPDGWNLSTHSGGRMRDLDPVFSVDEEWVQRHVPRPVSLVNEPLDTFLSRSKAVSTYTRQPHPYWCESCGPAIINECPLSRYRPLTRI